MEIISNLDIRYKSLPLNYTKEDIINTETEHSVYYFIPPELVNFEYKHNWMDIRNLINYDKDKDWCNFCSSIKLAKVLKITCNLTVQDYFDLTILHINDTELRPKCKYCGTPLKFTKISRGGYPNICRSIDCISKAMNENRLPDFSDTINSVESQAKGRCTQFKSSGFSSDVCAFYVGSIKDNIKFGITSKYIWDRVSWNGSKLKNYHILFTDYRSNIADLECLVKIKLNTIKEELPYTELNNLFKIIKDSIKELNLINLGNKLDFY